MRVGNAVQIGLDRSAELLFLTLDNWKEWFPGSHQMVNCPDDLFEDIDEWNYFGADQNLYSIAHVLDAYSEPASKDIRQQYMNRSKWLCVNVLGSNSLHQVDIWGFRGHEYKIFVPSLSLSELFQNFELETVDILMVDIEGGEFEVFKEYDWKIKPRFLSIEMHPDFERSECAYDLWFTLKSQGYQLNWSTLEGHGYSLDWSILENQGHLHLSENSFVLVD